MWDLVPRPGIKPRSPALGTQCLTHLTTRAVPGPAINEYREDCNFVLVRFRPGPLVGKVNTCLHLEGRVLR